MFKLNTKKYSFRMSIFCPFFTEQVIFWHDILSFSIMWDKKITGPGCSKLTTSLVNVSLNF